MTERAPIKSSRRESLSLHDAAELILGECRMVLPGIQALFGFQLIAVFSDGFARLSLAEQRVHLVAIVLVVIATAVVMTPAAYQRQQGAREVHLEFITLSTQLLLYGMIALALAIALDVYLIARLVLGSSEFALLVAAFVCAVFAKLWLVLPRAHPSRRALRERPARATEAT